MRETTEVLDASITGRVDTTMDRELDEVILDTLEFRPTPPVTHDSELDEAVVVPFEPANGALLHFVA